MMQKSITFKNANISFSDVGKGTAVVLIHGFLENANMWREIVTELVKRNRIIAIDLLGHGKSDCLGYVHSMDLFAASIKAVLRSLKIRKYILVGHSLGGYISLDFAKTNSNRIKGLCLLNSTSNEDSEERKKIRLRANKMVKNNFESMVKMSVSNLFHPDSLLKFKEKIEAVKKEAIQTTIQGYIAANEGMRIRSNTNSVLLENNFKKLIVVGKKDPVLDVEISKTEAKQTNSEFVMLTGGHMSHIENKDELIAILKEFIKSCSSKL
jgi:pimeloyl-ACP methyl ester carboxylesterase